MRNLKKTIYLHRGSLMCPEDKRRKKNTQRKYRILVPVWVPFLHFLMPNTHTVESEQKLKKFKSHLLNHHNRTVKLLSKNSKRHCYRSYKVSSMAKDMKLYGDTCRKQERIYYSPRWMQNNPGIPKFPTEIWNRGEVAWEDLFVQLYTLLTTYCFLLLDSGKFGWHYVEIII